MGLETTIPGPTDSLSWPELQAGLAKHPPIPKLVMIDQLPAFPDEIPEAAWQELRFGYPEGMVTLRRTPTAFQVIVWGTADANLLTRRDQLAAILTQLMQAEAT
ncbi:MAG: hypothetical protein ACRC8S_17835 [Fimbriiglobus sp.]